MGVLSPNVGEICRALYVGRGSSAGPSLSFEGRATTGFYLVSDNTIGVAIDGVEVLTISATALGTIVGTTGTQTLTNKTISLASNTLTATSAQMLTAISDETGTGLLVFATTPTLTTPIIGAATGTSVVLTGAISSSGTAAGIGYATGAGGTVTQQTNKTTGATLDRVTGNITMAAGSIAGDGNAAFVLTNSAIATEDMVLVQHDAVGTIGAYVCTVAPGAGTASINVHNVTAGALDEAIVLKFIVVKAVIA